jgi:hypothetical protein
MYRAVSKLLVGDGRAARQRDALAERVNHDFACMGFARVSSRSTLPKFDRAARLCSLPTDPSSRALMSPRTVKGLMGNSLGAGIS